MEEESQKNVITIAKSNPVTTLIIILVLVGFLYWIFNLGKSNAANSVPDQTFVDVNNDPALGKTPAEVQAFSAKAKSYAKRVYDVTKGVDVGIFTEQSKLKATLYGEMRKLNKAQMSLVNAKWIDDWFAKNNESMFTAIDGDNHWYIPTPDHEKELLKILIDFELNDA